MNSGFLLEITGDVENDSSIKKTAKELVDLIIGAGGHRFKLSSSSSGKKSTISAAKIACGIKGQKHLESAIEIRWNLSNVRVI